MRAARCGRPPAPAAHRPRPRSALSPNGAPHRPTCPRHLAASPPTTNVRPAKCGWPHRVRLWRRGRPNPQAHLPRVRAIRTRAVGLTGSGVGAGTAPAVLTSAATESPVAPPFDAGRKPAAAARGGDRPAAHLHDSALFQSLDRSREYRLPARGFDACLSSSRPPPCRTWTRDYRLRVVRRWPAAPRPTRVPPESARLSIGDRRPLRRFRRRRRRSRSLAVGRGGRGVTTEKVCDSVPRSATPPEAGGAGAAWSRPRQRARGDIRRMAWLQGGLYRRNSGRRWRPPTRGRRRRLRL